jgi:hypothetical protein
MTCDRCNLVWTEGDYDACPLCAAKAEIEELKAKQMSDGDLFDLKNQIGDIIDLGNSFRVVLRRS